MRMSMMSVAVGVVLALIQGSDNSAVAQVGSGSSGGTDGETWIPSDEYRERYGGHWIPSDEYRERYGGHWIPSDEYRERHGGHWIPSESRPDFWEEFWQRAQGSRTIFTGVRLIQWGVGATIVVVADDLTVIGITNDPLVLVTGGTAVAGGVILIGSGVYLIIETLYDE
jgi:hypothetical protein